MKKHIEAEKGELIIVSDEGHRAIIPAKDRKYFLDSLNGCDDCINKYIQQLPMMSNYAEDGSLVPDDGDPIKKETYEQWGDRIRKMSPNLDYTKDGDYNYRGAYEAGLEPVEVDNNGVKEYHLGSRNPKTGEILKYRSHPTFNQAISEDVKMGYVPYEKDGRIYTVDRKSKEYKDLYDSGKLLGYDRVNDLYIAPDLGGATIKATKPQWMKDKEALEKEYSKDWYIDNNLPKFSRSMGVSPNNMGGNQKGYDEYINNKLAESILKRNPNFDKDYSNNRLKTLSNYSQKELEIIKNSNLSYKVEPSIWSKFEQGLLSVGNAGSPVTFKNENLTQKEAKKEDNPLNILQPLSVPSKMVQSVYKKDYSLKDALKGKQNNAGIVEDIVTDPLNLVGAGLVGKLSKTDKIIDATKVGSKVLNKLDDAVNNINRIKFDDFKNDNEFFRVIVGDEAFDDIVQTQKIRTKQPSSVKNTPPNTINLDRRGSTAFPSFSKGSPSLSYANDNPNHYIIRTADESIKPSTSGRHGKGTTMFPTDKSGKHLTELDASKVQVYKHVGNGEYELVNTAKSDEAIDATKVGSKVLNKGEALSRLSNENKINLSKTSNNFANKSKNVSESLTYELTTLHKKLNPSYQKRAEKELEYANKWQEEWYNHPETMKRLQSLSDEFNTYRNQQVDLINKKNKILRENSDNLKHGFTQEDLNDIYRDIPYNTENDWTEIMRRINDKNYISTFQSKDAKLQKILKGEERTHKGNYGISGHYLDKDYSGKRQNLVDKYSSKIRSTGIHEGNHGLTEGNRLIPISEREEMVKIFGQSKEIPVRNEKGGFNTYDEYLEDPTEIYARIMELREYMGKKPGELVASDEIERLIQLGKNGNTPVNFYFFSKIQDKEKLKKLFNRLPAIAPLFGISYLQSQNKNKTEQ